jgi:hypothetical protein
MHPELLSSLAAEHRRDLAAAVPAGGGPPSARAGRPAHPRPWPRFRVSWSRTTLSAVSGSRRGRSLVIVISATRAL